jgi:chain length determinant protein tyrosine kinase EpsG
MTYQNANITALHSDVADQSSIGRMLLEQGKISVADAERVLQVQKETGMRFGEAAQALGLITASDVAQVLAAQFQYPYLQPGEGNFSSDLVAAYQPFSARVEMLRALRSELILRWFGAGRKSLAIFGVDVDDGVSLLAANLAIVFSQLGERTLLVDANMRAPAQHELFNLGHRPGLSDVLAGRAKAELASKIPSLLSLSVMTAGTTAPNPQELLGRQQFNAFNDGTASGYDVVLYAAPSLGASVDALAIASRCCGVLLAATRNVSTLADIRRAGEKIRGCGAEIVGTVMLSAH